MPANTSTARRRATTLRVHQEAYAAFSAAAAAAHKPLTQYMDEVAARESDRLFWAQLREAVAELKADPAAWAAYKAEQAELDGTVGDGLAADEDWSEWIAATR
jgi:uncharacterized protein (DUF1778 family)